MRERDGEKERRRVKRRGGEKERRREGEKEK